MLTLVQWLYQSFSLITTHNGPELTRVGSMLCLRWLLKNLGEVTRKSVSSASGMCNGKAEVVALGVAGTSSPAEKFVNSPGNMIDGMRADTP